MPPLEAVPPAVPRPRKRAQETASPVTNARRQSMTAREVDAFNNMFNMIFNAVAEQRGRNGKGPGAGAGGMRGGAAAAMAAGRQDPLTGAGIGSGPDGSSAMGDLFGKLRRHSRKYKWSAAEDAELERKKEEIELCDTDQQLLEWAMREVFEESARYEEAARQAVARAESASTPKVSSPDSESIVASADAKTDGGPLTGNKGAAASPLPLQPPAYPHLLADLMRTFRDKFHDPHLALSIFEHARTRSIASYVFGCTTQAYNELLRTRWACFRDLRGVVDALAEMRVNGIAPDARTRALVEELRREVGARTVWQEERNVGTGEVFEMLGRIEQLSAKDKPKSGAKATGAGATAAKSKRWNSSAERWKTDDAPRKNDTWKFGEWDLKPKNKTSRSRQQQSTPPTGPPQSEWTQELAFE
ncbi:hypothetical protein M0805_005548 [Coniferiporia weirii]|nr:hypothetical protein M0805_005548 [Coniferiporia weirii]